MSTIEEAREQAREALAQWDAPGGNHSGQVIGFLASALRALLDATEPPAQADKPAEDEREALKYLCRRHAACRSTGWPPYFEHSVGCAEWNSGRVAEGARR